MSELFELEGDFVQTTDIFDPQSIQDLDVNSQDFKEFLVRLRQSINEIAISLNGRDAGKYVETEFVNGQTWYPDKTITSEEPVERQVFRKVIVFGALPNNTTKTVAHGIDVTSTFKFTRMYSTATDTTALTSLPIPYPSAITADIIELYRDATNVAITTGKDLTAYDDCDVVLEYIKQ